MSGKQKEGDSSDRGQNIQVFVRCRPLNDQENASRSASIVELPGPKELVVRGHAINSITKTYQFDRTFGPSSSQEDVYSNVVEPLILQVLQGYNCTVFAYGQTGTGKTFTMEGGSKQLNSQIGGVEANPSAGIIPRALTQIFDELRSNIDSEFSVRVSFLELYNEEIFDLLSPSDDLTKLRMYEDATKKGSVIIQGLEEVQVNTKKHVQQIIEQGSAKRKTAETLMNATSSRSHTVFTVTVHVKEASLTGEEVLRIGKLHLVDLAGSENIGRSGAVAGRAREAGNINQSLLTLGRVITCLVERSGHVPYRESKLTRLLQDSLGGRTKTSIIATVSPAAVNLEETLSTLDYAHRAKNITNRPEVNQKLSKNAVLKEYSDEIERLRKELMSSMENNGIYLAQENYKDMVEQIERQNMEMLDMTKEMNVLKETMEKKLKMLEECEDSLREKREELDKKNQNLELTDRKLEVTSVILQQTVEERDLQKYLVDKYVETELTLAQQARKLLTVADDNDTDIKLLEGKLERQKSMEDLNVKAKGEFEENFNQQIDMITNRLKETNIQHTEEYARLAKEISSAYEEKASRLESLSAMIASIPKWLTASYDTYKDNIGELQSDEEKLLSAEEADAKRPGQLFQDELEVFKNEKMDTYISSLSEAITQQSDSLAALQEKAEADILAMKHKILEEIDMNVKLLQQIRDSAVDHLASEEALVASIQETVANSAASWDSFGAQFHALIKEYNCHHQRVMENDKQVGQLTGSLEVKSEFCTSFAYSKLDSSSLQQEVKAMESTMQVNSAKRGKIVNDIKDRSTRCHQFGEDVRSGQKQFLADTQRINAGLTTQTNGFLDSLQRLDSEILQTKVKDQIKGTQDKLAEDSGKTKETINNDKERIAVLQTGLTNSVNAIKDKVIHGVTQAEEDVKKVNRDVAKFVQDDLQVDQPTGTTPARAQRTYPHFLAATSPQERIINRYKKQNLNVAMASELDLDQMGDDSVFSGSARNSLCSNVSDTSNLGSVSTEPTSLKVLVDDTSDYDENTASPSGSVHSSTNVSSKRRGLKKPKVYNKSKDILTTLDTNVQ